MSALPVATAPTLETRRLVLRPLGLQDLDAYVAFWQDPEVVRYISGTPLPREQSWRRLLATTGHWHLLGFGFFAIEEKASGRFIGEAGFQEMRRDLHPSIEGSLETGWGIAPDCQGKGYASEALAAALAWARAALPDTDFSCIVSPENRASLHLAAKLGFAPEAQSSYQGKPIVILRMGGAKHLVAAPRAEAATSTRMPPTRS